MDLGLALDLLHKLFTQDTNTKLLVAVIGAVAAAIFQGHRKRRRLRSAIRMEVERTSDAFKAAFSSHDRSDLEHRVRTTPNYLVVVLTSDRHVIIGNLTDDIAYMNKYAAGRVLRFNDISEQIDDALHFMRTHEFAGLPTDRKLAVLAVPFDAQDVLQGLAMQLLKEL